MRKTTRRQPCVSPVWRLLRDHGSALPVVVPETVTAIRAFHR